MKHLATIQFEFLKIARKWDDLTLEEQKGYLSRHPKSKRKLTAKPETNNNIKKKLRKKRKSISIPTPSEEKAPVAEKTIKIVASETPKLDKKLEKIFDFYNENLKSLKSKKDTVSDDTFKTFEKLFNKTFPGFLDKMHMDMDGVITDVEKRAGLLVGPIGRNKVPERTKKLNKDEFTQLMKDVFIDEGEGLPKIDGESDPYTDLKKKLKLNQPFSTIQQQQYKDIESNLDGPDKKYAKYLVSSINADTDETRELVDTSGNVPIIKSQSARMGQKFEVPIANNRMVGHNWDRSGGGLFLAMFDSIDSAKKFIEDLPEIERKGKLRLEIKEKTTAAEKKYRNKTENASITLGTSVVNNILPVNSKFKLNHEQRRKIAFVLTDPLHHTPSEIKETIDEFDDYVSDIKNNKNLVSNWELKALDDILDNADAIKSALKDAQSTAEDIDKLMEEHGYEKTAKDIELPEGFKFSDKPTLGESWNNNKDIIIDSNDGTMEFVVTPGRPGQELRFSGEIYYKIPERGNSVYTVGRRGIDSGIYEDFTNSKPSKDIIQDWANEVIAKQEKISQSISVPVGGGTWHITPENIEAIAKRLRAGETQSFAPHGMGTGYVLSTKRGRFSNRASNATEEAFGISPLFVESYDHD